MQLIIDIGNTNIKLGVFKNRDLICKKITEEVNLIKVTSTLFKEYKITKTIVSSVVQKNKPLNDYLLPRTKLIDFNHNTKIPLINKYDSPKTLGADRLANAIALAKLFEKQDALSIDIGTCIKYDFVSKKGVYKGGAISPGQTMRYKALNKQTHKLPVITPKKSVSLIGTTTAASIQSGIEWGIRAEIEGIINKYCEQYFGLKIVFTGGNSVDFAKEIKNSIFARPNLTLEGLNEVLLFNE